MFKKIILNSLPTKLEPPIKPKESEMIQIKTKRLLKGVVDTIT